MKKDILTMIHHLNTIRMAAVKKTENNKCQQGCGESGIYVQFKIVWPLRKTAWQFLKKLNIELPYYPSIPFLGMYSKEQTVLFTETKRWKQTKYPSTDE